ncbi:hypothetical protein [Muricoccus radiodurans]|uniref:hypothetical protein n=1 Tax=Muricoccus radiodurans TaxID=2231721 RepID=UPI003CE99E9F
MPTLPRLALVAALALGAPLFAGSASAAPASAAPMIGAAVADQSLVEDVRYVTRCRPRIVSRRDRFGRPVTVRREVCRRVWVGRGRY